MNYRITLVNVSSQVTGVELTGAPVRIGSGPNCDLRISNLIPQALTVFPRDGAVCVLSRVQRDIHVQGQLVRPGCTVVWPVGAKLIADNLTLRLDAMTSSHQANTVATKPDRTEAQTQAIKSRTDTQSHAAVSKSNKVPQYFIIIASLAAVAFLTLANKSVPPDRGESLKMMSIAFATIANSANTEAPEKIRADRVCRLLAQLALANALNNDSTVRLARTELRNLCDSIAASSTVSEPERERVSNLRGAIGQFTL